jgi:hypothetical protein
VKRNFDAVATYGIAVLAFALSYSKLVDLAERAGYGVIMSHAWPLIVDGLAILAARSVMRSRSEWYAWSLLVAGTAVSCAGAVAGAMFADGPLPPVAAAAVRFVPALCLPFALKLAEKVRHAEVSDVSQDDVAPVAPTPEPDVAPVIDDVAPEPEPLHLVAEDGAPKPRKPKFTDEQIAQALADVAAGMSQREAGRRIGTSGNTVRRWLAQAEAVA